MQARLPQVERRVPAHGTAAQTRCWKGAPAGGPLWAASQRQVGAQVHQVVAPAGPGGAGPGRRQERNRAGRQARGAGVQQRSWDNQKRELPAQTEQAFGPDLAQLSTCLGQGAGAEQAVGSGHGVLQRNPCSDSDAEMWGTALASRPVCLVQSKLPIRKLQAEFCTGQRMQCNAAASGAATGGRYRFGRVSLKVAIGNKAFSCGAAAQPAARPPPAPLAPTPTFHQRAKGQNRLTGLQWHALRRQQRWPVPAALPARPESRPPARGG